MELYRGFWKQHSNCSYSCMTMVQFESITCSSQSSNYRSGKVECLCLSRDLLCSSGWPQLNKPHAHAPNARDASVNPHIQLGRVLLDLKSKRWKSELVKERMAYVTTHWGAEKTHQNAQGRRRKSPDPAVVIKIWDSRTRKT